MFFFFFGENPWVCYVGLVMGSVTFFFFQILFIFYFLFFKFEGVPNSVIEGIPNFVIEGVPNTEEIKKIKKN